MTVNYLHDHMRFEGERTTHLQRMQEFVPSTLRRAKMNKTTDTNFVERLFGVDTFYFFREPENLIGRDNAYIKEMTFHAIQELTRAKDELHPDLYETFQAYLFLLRTLVASSAWDNNRMLSKELLPYNQAVDAFPNVGWETNEEIPSPLVHKHLEFSVADNGEVVTDYLIEASEVKGLSPLVFFGDRGMTKRERAESAMNLLCLLIREMKETKSYKMNSKTDSEKGEMESGMHQEAMNSAKKIGMAMQYLINSTSWFSNELFGFDKIEIRWKSRACWIQTGICSYYDELEQEKIRD